MTDSELNDLLSKTLAPVEPNAEINRNLIRKMEDRRMKHISKKKIVGLAAACCLLIGTVSVASSGKIAYIIGRSSATSYGSYAQLDTVWQQAGFAAHTVEQFSNGYQFSEMSLSKTENRDENDNALAKYNKVHIDYEKNGADSITLNLTEAQYISHDGERTPDAQTTIDGITVSYLVDTYKSVPAGYELTAQDEANLTRDDYYISEGADSVSENQVTSAYWEQDGVHYLLQNIYGVTSSEVIFEMAQEIIEAQ